MRTTITGYYPEEGFSLDVSPQLLELLKDSIDTQILKSIPQKQSKATELEIILSTDIGVEEVYIDQLTDKEQTQVISYQFYLPYSKIVSDGVFNPSEFIHHFVRALGLALADLLKLKPETFDHLEKKILTEITDNKLDKLPSNSFQQALLAALAKNKKST